MSGALSLVTIVLVAAMVFAAIVIVVSVIIVIMSLMQDDCGSRSDLRIGWLCSKTPVCSTIQPSAP